MAIPARAIGIILAGKRAATPSATLDLFMDPFCPFCSRMWQVLRGEDGVLAYLEAKHARSVRVTMYLLPQPWHPQSGMLCEGVLAAQEQSEAAAVALLDKIWDPELRKAFSDVATYSMSRKDIYDKIVEMAASVEGLDTAMMRGRLEPLEDGGVGVTKQLKFYIKHGRLLGIHVSPTVVANGIRDDSVSSSWKLPEWTDYLAKVGAAEGAAAE